MTPIACLEAWYLPDAWAFRRGGFAESGDRGDRAGHHSIPIVAITTRDPRKDVPPNWCAAIRDAVMASRAGKWGAVQRPWRPSAGGGRNCPGCAACDEALARET